MILNKFFSLVTVALAFGTALASGEQTMPQMQLTFSGELTPSMVDYISGSMLLPDTDGTISQEPSTPSDDYNMQGLPVKDMSARGLYIVDGMKILVK